jgi:hypothetical protein
MKAVLALVVLYVAAFLIATQGASQNSVQAASQDATPAQAGSAAIDSAKEADIRSLVELVGARDALRDVSAKGAEQFRENLLASVPNDGRGQQFVNTFIDRYQRKFNPDDMADQLAAIYDKHFTANEIKDLLTFYGSPLGQKFATEMPKIASETQAAHRAASIHVAKEVLQDLRKQYPGIGAQARLIKPRAAQTEQTQQQAQAQNQAGASQP